jgi:rhodanese-related sulfurtransferase
MPPPTMLTSAQLTRLIGLPDSPAIVDVRPQVDRDRDPRTIPGAAFHEFASTEDFGHRIGGGRAVIIVCRNGGGTSQGVAARLRHAGVEAETLEGGLEAWTAAGGLMVKLERLPRRDPSGRTLWVTRSRPKIDRIACPWLIRRFVDPSAEFLFVAGAQVEDVAERFGAAPFDVDGVSWSHRGELCTFDVMLDGFGLRSPALDRLAVIVRGADTGRLDLAPQAAGLLAASLGLSRMHRDDLAQLEVGLTLYDAFYRWSRDATEEAHNWPTGHIPARPIAETMR